MCEEAGAPGMLTVLECLPVKGGPVVVRFGRFRESFKSQHNGNPGWHLDSTLCLYILMGSHVQHQFICSNHIGNFINNHNDGVTTWGKNMVI